MIENELDNIITLNDEDGNAVDFEFLDLIEYLGKEYVVLYPCDIDDDTPGEVVILEVEDDENAELESYNSVEDMDVLNAVFEIFKEKFKDEFNFVDWAEVYDELANAIRQKGLKNVNIYGKNKNHFYFMISADIDLDWLQIFEFILKI